jgi:TPR repeat protein
LGNIYYVEQNYQDAYIWYKKSADNGDTFAALQLSELYFNGQGAEQNYDMAKQYLLQALPDWPEANYGLGMVYYLKQEYSEAFKHFLKSAEMNNANAQNNVGLMYIIGLGIPSDCDVAYEWLMKSHKNGEPMAGGNIGAYYALKPEPDYEEAEKWLLESSDAGNHEATRSLASLYLDGHAHPIDSAKGVALLEKAAEQGSWKAAENLADTYAEGYHEIEKNPAESEQWRTRSVELKKLNDENMPFSAIFFPEKICQSNISH